MRRNSAARIAELVGGKPTAGGYLLHCPVPGHGRGRGDRNPSLSIREAENGKLLVKCFAGCEAKEIMAVLRAQRLISTYVEPRNARHSNSASQRGISRVTDGSSRAARNGARARAIWGQTLPAQGTLAQKYLLRRCLSLPTNGSIRFHPALWHRDGFKLPAMVAVVTHGVDGKIQAIHRTYLASDGTDKAKLNPVKAMLGPCRNGVVRLGTESSHILVGEGIETCLSEMQLTGIPAWAALSASGLTSLSLPAPVGRVTILADGDEPGIKAASQAADRWRREGRRVDVAQAPIGMDFNDVLVRDALWHKGGQK